jgi:hydroxymethylpyrimidine pyrophosphatase-like HAD family hydrolase
MSLIDRYCKILDSDMIDVLEMQDSFASSRWIEIFSEGVSKYNAIKVVSDIEGIDNKDIICFGDGRNDIDMIKNCGIGVAMGNALDVVKDVSDYVTISHNEDGIVYFLKGYLSIDKNTLK